MQTQFMNARQPRQVGLVVYLMQNLRLRGRPHQSFSHGELGINALQLCRWQFSHKETFKQNFVNRSAILSRMRPFLRFGTPFGAFRDNLRCSSWTHRKARNGLPISVNWTFLTRCYGWIATSENGWKIGDFAPTRSLWLKISGHVPTNNFCNNS